MSERDLFVVVADLDAENTIKTLLAERQQSLGVRLEFSARDGDLLRYSGRDSGCYKDAVDVLRPPQRTYKHALLVFDRDGSGAESRSAEDIETEIERKLSSSGWGDDRAAAVVIEPELEAWVWAASPRVADVLGWSKNRAGLRRFLQQAGVWNSATAKPDSPKLALRKALMRQGRPLGAVLFGELAQRVGLARCADRAFRKFSGTLRRWFPDPAPHSRPRT